MAELSDKELNILAYTLLGEAAGEGREGMEAVMWTIKNRAESGRYSDNPAMVATQSNSKGIHQYSTWNTKGNGGNSPKSRFSISSPEFKEAFQVVQRVMAGEVKDPTGGATHFYAEGIAKPYWFDEEGPAGEIKIGKHRFAARNSADQVDSADNAADAAKLLGEGGRLMPRPLGKPAPLAFAPEPEQTLEADGLTTRKVQTVAVDPETGRPILTADAGSSSSNRPSQSSYPLPVPGKAPERLPVSTAQPKRESVRLAELRAPQNSRDLAGEAARVVSNNAAAAEKTSRSPTPDRVGEAARVSTTNAAAAAKQPRAGSTAEKLQAVQPAVRGLDKTPDQIAQEADNARMSGYRDIQEMGPSSRGAKPTAQPAAKPGVIKTAGTVTDGGTRLPQAGDTPLPKGVVPQVDTTPKPRPVTTFLKKPLTASTMPTPEPAKRLVVDKPLSGAPTLTGARPDATIRDQRAEQQLNRKAQAGGKKTLDITGPEPTVEQVIAVREAARPKGPVARRPVNAPIVLANGVIAAQPAMVPVAQRIAEQVAASYATTQFQQDRFQTISGQQMPGATDNDRWKTGYETAPKPSTSKPTAMDRWF